MHHGRLCRRCMDENAAMISGSQEPQRKIPGAEMVDTGFETRQLAADKIQLKFVQGAGTGGSPEVNLSAGICVFLGDTGGKIKNS